MIRPLPRATGVVLALAFAACSTAERPTQPEECRTHSDCPEDEVCGPRGRCIPASDVPPLAYLAFDIQEALGGQTAFRAEIFGCDEEIARRDQVLQLERAGISQTLELSAVSVDDVGETTPLPATFDLTQPSRFARPPGPRRTIAHPLVDGEMPTDTVVAWPRYRPENRQPNPQLNPQLAGGGFILWTITPKSVEDGPDRAPMLVMLTPPAVIEDAACTHDDECDPSEQCVGWRGARACRPMRNPNTKYENIRYQEGCERPVRGRVAWIDSDHERGDPIGSVNIGVRHRADPEGDGFGIWATADEPLDEREPECSTDADCIAGAQFCDQASRQCFLNLEGRVANSTSIDNLMTDELGFFTTRVYTYCEGEAAAQLRRHYIVNVSDRDPNRVVPSITYDAEVSFPPPLGPGDPVSGDLDGVLCVPDWGPPHSLLVSLHGDPVTLVGAGEHGDGYTCCGIGCLPRDAEDAEQTQTVTEVSCSGRTSQPPTLRFEAPVTLSPQGVANWREAGCALPRPADDDPRVIGSLTRTARSVGQTNPCGFDDSTQCEVVGLAAGPGGSPRPYRVRLETPEGSLFRSVDISVDVEADVQDLEITLQRRVLVRGRVSLPIEVCVADDDCGSEAASVMAERLRMPGERRPPGPHFHQVPTFFDPARQTEGHYVLPLDPGVWVVTALPERGTEGGPAVYAVLDLRDEVDREQDFVLDFGAVVTLEIDDGFDPRTTVAPLDGGSWREARLEHPGRVDLAEDARFIDLSAVGECWGDEGQACRIRRLFPSGPFPASQTGEIRFSARLAPSSSNAGQDCFPR
jgi:hypothetical protein